MINSNLRLGCTVEATRPSTATLFNHPWCHKVSWPEAFVELWLEAFRRIGGPLAEAHSEALANRLQDRRSNVSIQGGALAIGGGLAKLETARNARSVGA